MKSESSISRRLVRLNVMVSGAALIIAAVALLIYDQTSYRRLLVENVSAQADVVGKNSVSALLFADPDSAAGTLSALERVPNILSATLFTPEGQLFASYSRSPESKVAELTVRPYSGRVVSFERRQLLVTTALYSGERVAGYLVIKAGTSTIRTRLTRYLMIVGVVLLLSLLAAITLSTAFRRSVAQPIVEMADIARTVSVRRDYSIRVPPVRTRDELSVLVDAFNEMLGGIQNRDATLDRERAQLRAILDNAPVGIMVVDTKRKTLLANKTINEVFQESMETSERAPSDWKVFLPNHQPVALEDRPMARALRGERTEGEEYIVVRHDGVETWIRASAAPIRGKDGEVVAGLIVIVGIDEHKKAQEALLQSEKLAAAGRLAASISHEINNPLESVTNLLFIALSDPSISPDLRKILVQADEELTRVSHIATQTLRFYRQATNPTSVDMGQLIDSVLQLLIGKLRNTDVAVVREYTHSEPITCFEGEMRQVFTNLISNALDASAGTRGQLRLRTKQIKNSKRGESGIQVTIADNGHGVPIELAKRIFEPFYTTKGSRGTGLGLWVTQEIVAKHHGTIRLRSKVGLGTVFVLFIPFHGAKEGLQSARSA